MVMMTMMAVNLHLLPTYGINPDVSIQSTDPNFNSSP